MAARSDGEGSGEDQETGLCASIFSPMIPYICVTFEKRPRLTTLLALQIELVEEETGNTDPKATFRLIIIQTELERFKYLVRSFLRSRIAKVS